MATPSETTTPTGGPSKISVVTPSRRAYSAEPPSRNSSRRSVHTPLDNTTSRDLLSSVRRSASGRKANAPTPHARAAARALDLRRTAIFTPGRNRRRSIREQRETPRDVLRALSQRLASTTQEIQSSSSPGEGTGDKRRRKSVTGTILEEDEDDDLPIDAPRLSLPLEEDDDSELQPPRLSDVGDYTTQSMEMPRRAISEQPRLSRGSLGSIRMSDFRGVDLEEMEAEVDLGYFPRANLEDTALEIAEDDVSYERIEEERRNTLAMNRESFGLDMPDHNESTFVLNLQHASDHEQSPVRLEDQQSGAYLEGDVEDDAQLQTDDEDIGVDQEEPDPVDVDVTETRGSGGLKRAKKRKRVKLSAYGMEYPSLPSAVIKRLAQTFAQSSGISKPKITPDTLAALSQATDWFFEQVGGSLQAYAKHAGRKTIEESDIITLMRRQRQIGPTSTPFSLAQRHLPRELVQNLRMPVPVPVKRRKRANADDVDEG